MLATPFLLNKADRVAAFLVRERSVSEPVEQSCLVDGHVILCGYGTFGKAVSQRLDEADIAHVVVIDNTPEQARALEACSLNYIIGSATE